MRGCHAPSTTRFRAAQWMTIADSTISIGWRSLHVTGKLLEYTERFAEGETRRISLRFPGRAYSRNEFAKFPRYQENMSIF